MQLWMGKYTRLQQLPKETKELYQNMQTRKQKAVNVSEAFCEEAFIPPKKNIFSSAVHPTCIPMLPVSSSCCGAHQACLIY